MNTENYRNHRGRLSRKHWLYQPETRDHILKSSEITPAQYQEGLSRLKTLRAEIGRIFEDIDVLISPTLRTEPLPLSHCRAPFALDFNFTAAFNLYGRPAISVPCAITPSGFPVGLRIAGSAGREDRVLALAYTFEQATNWHNRHPPLPE